MAAELAGCAKCAKYLLIVFNVIFFVSIYRSEKIKLITHFFGDIMGQNHFDLGGPLGIANWSVHSCPSPLFPLVQWWSIEHYKLLHSPMQATIVLTHWPSQRCTKSMAIEAKLFEQGGMKMLIYYLLSFAVKLLWRTRYERRIFPIWVWILYRLAFLELITEVSIRKI